MNRKLLSVLAVAVAVAVAVAGCTRPPMVDKDVFIFSVNHRGHTFVGITVGGGVSAMHSPDCECMAAK